jgi:hypothetical protein
VAADRAKLQCSFWKRKASQPRSASITLDGDGGADDDDEQLNVDCADEEDECRSSASGDGGPEGAYVTGST